MSERIALFSPSLAGGGAERVMVNLAREFVRRGLLVDLVLAKAEGAYLAQVPSGARVVDLGARRVATAIPGLARYLRRERPVVLLSAQDHANLAALLARRFGQVSTRLVASVQVNLSRAWENSSDARDRPMRMLINRIYPWADGIIAVSQGVAEDLCRHVPAIRGRLVVIYNPVVEPNLYALAEAPLTNLWFSPNEPPVILGVGRLVAQKDFPTLIQAFARVRATREARLVILGEGQDRQKLESLIRELGLAADILLPGFVDNPMAYFARAAVFALSSIFEGFGNVLVEAMAVGTPVVSTDCPSGPAEIIDNGRYGRLVPVGDGKALASAIGATLDGPNDTEAITRRAGHFSLEKIADQYLDVLGLHQ